MNLLPLLITHISIYIIISLAERCKAAEITIFCETPVPAKGVSPRQPDHECSPCRHSVPVHSSCARSFYMPVRPSCEEQHPSVNTSCWGVLFSLLVIYLGKAQVGFIFTIVRSKDLSNPFQGPIHPTCTTSNKQEHTHTQLLLFIKI